SPVITTTAVGGASVYALLLGGHNPVSPIFGNYVVPYGVMVTVCDVQGGVVAYSVHLTGQGDGIAVDRTNVLGANAQGCMTTWFADTGKLTTMQVTVDPVQAGPPLGFYPVLPCRAADTRTSQQKTGLFGPPALAASGERSFPMTSSGCGLPGSAAAYSLNLTAIPSELLPYLSTWPTGQPYPNVSTLNSTDASTLANAAIVPAGVNGSITILSGGDTDLIIDTNGYFAPPNGNELAFYPLTPCRIADTRDGQNKTGAFGPPALAASAERNFPIL